MKDEHSGSGSQLEPAEEIVRFGVSMPASIAASLDAWRTKNGYPSRSEAVRDLVRERMVADQWEVGEDSEMVGVVTLVYKHSTRELSDNLTEMQHHHHEVAVAALHIHLSYENCLEVIVLRGNKSEVMHLANHLMSARGVLHGKFVPSTTGSTLE
jgi:CopG family nickel-responsive transcriptional regulator